MGCWPGPRASRPPPATARSWPSRPRTGAASASSSTPSPATTSSTTRTTSSSPGSPAPVTTNPRARRGHEPPTHRIAAHPRRRPGQPGLHRARIDLQLPRRPRRSGGRRAHLLPRAPGRRRRVVLGPRAVRGAARPDRDRGRPALVEARDAHRGAGWDRGGRRAGRRPAALAAARARLRVRRGRRLRSCRGRRAALVRDGERHPRHGRRRDARLLPHRGLDGARHRRARAALRRPLVRRAGRRVGGARRRRRPIATRSPGGRHRELRRLRALEHLADRLRRGHAGARATAIAVERQPGRGDVVSPARGRWAVLGVVCASLLAIVVDNTIVNVALPTLVRELDADLSELQWVVYAYTLVFAGLLLLAGTLGDRFGRRRTLLAGLAVFGAGSAAAAFAGGVDQLVLARAVMGAGAAFIMPATLSLLTHVFVDTRERAMAIGIWAATAGVGVALGPVVGGVLLDHFWWGSIFIVNVPLTAIAVLAGRRLLPESRDPAARAIDWTGAALSGVGLVAFVWAIIEAPSKGWTSAPVLTAGAVASRPLGAFVAWQRRVTEPLLDVNLFANPRFSAASATVMVLFFALFGFLFLSTQYLQFVLGFSPSAAGVRVLPYAGAMIVFAPLSSALAARLGTKRVVTMGMFLFATGLAVAATVSTSTGYRRLGIALLLMGAGMGLAGAPATESIMGSLPPERANIGSAVNDTTRELGGALGVAIVGSIMSSLYGGQLPDAAPAAARESVGAAVQAGGGLADVAREAFVHAMSRASIVAALVAALGAFIAWRHLPARDVEPHAVVEPSAAQPQAAVG